MYNLSINENFIPFQVISSSKSSKQKRMCYICFCIHCFQAKFFLGYPLFSPKHSFQNIWFYCTKHSCICMHHHFVIKESHETCSFQTGKRSQSVHPINGQKFLNLPDQFLMKDWQMDNHSVLSGAPDGAAISGATASKMVAAMTHMGRCLRREAGMMMSCARREI